MGRWAQARKRGSHVEATLPLVAPVLVQNDDPADQLNWTWSGADPDHWTMYDSIAGLGIFVPFDTTDGAGRTMMITSAGSGKDWKVIGYDALDAPLTLFSNIVNATF